MAQKRSMCKVIIVSIFWRNTISSACWDWSISNNCLFSDFKAFDLIFKHLPKGYLLQLANSSTIRYAQLFTLPKLSGIYCNRGTSGIDGSTATSMGAAWISQSPTVFITGDLSFFYDINGLWHNYLKPSTRIIVINNQGGGIFRILPGERKTYPSL